MPVEGQSESLASWAVEVARYHTNPCVQIVTVRNATGARRRRLSPSPVTLSRSGTGVEHCHGPPVLRPAGNVVADRDRTLLAVRDRPHALRVHPARCEIVAHRLRAASAKRDVVLAGAALIGMPFNRERVLAVALKPLRLLLQGRNGLRCQLGRV